MNQPQSHTQTLPGRELAGAHQDRATEQPKNTAEWTAGVEWLSWLPSLFSFSSAGVSLPPTGSPSEQLLTPTDGMWGIPNRDSEAIGKYSSDAGFPFKWL